MICEPVYVVDGDTLRCAEERVRLVGIDAPEMEGHCRKGRVCANGDAAASRKALISLTTKGKVECQRLGYDRFGRTLARCTVGEVNLGCEMIRKGAAIARYGAC